MITADDLARLAKGATQGPWCGAGVEGCTCTMDRADGELREVLVNSLPQIEAALRLAEATTDPHRSDGSESWCWYCNGAKPKFGGTTHGASCEWNAYRTSKGE